MAIELGCANIKNDLLNWNKLINGISADYRVPLKGICVCAYAQGWEQSGCLSSTFWATNKNKLKGLEGFSLQLRKQHKLVFPCGISNHTSSLRTCLIFDLC